MTTYISLASSATMFPVFGTIRCSALTPELVRERLEKVQVVSALNDSHKSTIDVIQRRYGLELPLPPFGGDGKRLRPQVALQPGDELFVAQATLPRLAEGERHSDATVQAAPISFLRWRVPMRVEIKAPEGPRGLPRHVFAEVIDHAHSIALWMRGEGQLKDIDELRSDLAAEMKEFDAALVAWLSYGGSESDGKHYELDTYLEFADIAYKSLCMHYVGDESGAWWKVYDRSDENIDIQRGIDAMLLKYGRRAALKYKDHEAERKLIAPLFDSL